MQGIKVDLFKTLWKVSDKKIKKRAGTVDLEMTIFWVLVVKLKVLRLGIISRPQSRSKFVQYECRASYWTYLRHYGRFVECEQSGGVTTGSGA